MRPACFPSAVALVATALVCVSNPASAADDLEARAARLAALRQEIAALQEEIAEDKDELDVTLRALNAQRVDLDVQVRREELRVAALDSELARLVEANARDAGLEDAVRPALDAAFARARTAVAAGLPYRVAERTAAIDDLARQVAVGELSPTKGIGRLWAFLEDELRLTRENVLDRQVVPLPTGDTLAEVARLGMVAMYFRTTDGQVGHTVRTADGWSWTTVDGATDVRRVEALFEALAKGIRIGWFELPWAFGEVPR